MPDELILPAGRLLRPPGLWIPRMEFAPSRRCCCEKNCVCSGEVPGSWEVIWAVVSRELDCLDCADLSDTYIVTRIPELTDGATCYWGYELDPAVCDATHVMVKSVYNILGNMVHIYSYFATAGSYPDKSADYPSAYQRWWPFEFITCCDVQDEELDFFKSHGIQCNNGINSPVLSAIC